MFASYPRGTASLIDSEEVIRIRGEGNIIIFGLNNYFSLQMPNRLISRLAAEEYLSTVMKINKVLRKRLQLQKKLLIGCIFSCCTLGLSIIPALIYHKKSKRKINAILNKENTNLYHNLGLHWSLVKYYNGLTVEYMLQINSFKQRKIESPD